jgi:hypothetical protein
MPKIVRKTSHVEGRQPFGVYDGDVPPRGNYPGVIRSAVLKTSKNDNQYFNVLVELYTEDGPKSAYNGFPAWTMITLTEKEANIAREQAFYMAVCGKADVDVILDESDPPKVTKIGGVDPVGLPVRVDLRPNKNPSDETITMQGDGIYKPSEGQAAPATAGRKPRASRKANEDPDADLVQEPATPAAADQEVTVEAEKKPVTEPEDYHSMNLPKMKAYARDLGVDPKGSKTEVLAALDAHFDKASDEEFNPDGLPSPAQLKALPEAEFWAWAEKQYMPGDLNGMEVDETIEMLVEDEKALPF